MASGVDLIVMGALTELEPDEIRKIQIKMGWKSSLIFLQHSNKNVEQEVFFFLSGWPESIDGKN